MGIVKTEERIEMFGWTKRRAGGKISLAQSHEASYHFLLCFLQKENKLQSGSCGTQSESHAFDPDQLGDFGGGDV